MHGKLNIAVIGNGRVGTSFAKELCRLGFNVSHYARNPHKSSAMPIQKNLSDIDEKHDIYFSAVSDSAIAEVSEYLAEKFGTKLLGKSVVHFSGFLPAEVLFKCAGFGAVCESVHPCQTFYSYFEGIFRNTSWLVECSENRQFFWNEFLAALNSKLIFANDKIISNKALYHAAAAAASNYTAAVIKLSSLLADKIGIETEYMFRHLIDTTIDNNFKTKDAFALTGPIARSDIEAVKLHIETIGTDTNEAKAYCAMAIATLELANSAGMVNDNNYIIFKEMLLNYLK